jgi:hypothetical protein
MRIEQKKWTQAKGWTPEPKWALGESAQLVLLFGATHILKERTFTEQFRETWPNAHILGCSTSGEICGIRVSNDSLVATAVCFEHTQIKGGQIRLGQEETSSQAGERLVQFLDLDRLEHVLVLSDGLAVNGSDLVRGLTKHLPKQVTVTGGLAGDGDRFMETLVFWDSAPAKDTIAVLGFNGSRLNVGYGSMGGWDPFGPERTITHSKGNVLYELDGQSALELYKKYLVTIQKVFQPPDCFSHCVFEMMQEDLE